MFERHVTWKLNRRDNDSANKRTNESTYNDQRTIRVRVYPNQRCSQSRLRWLIRRPVSKSSSSLFCCDFGVPGDCSQDITGSGNFFFDDAQSLAKGAR